MGQEIKMQGRFRRLSTRGAHVPEMLTITPQVVKTAEGERTMWPANPFWYGIEISTGRSAHDTRRRTRRCSST